MRIFLQEQTVDIQRKVTYFWMAPSRTETDFVLLSLINTIEYKYAKLQQPNLIYI